MEHIYFTPAEFLVMLELSGSGGCTFLRGKNEPEPDREALTQAFLSLFQRGFLRQEGVGFAAGGSEQMFAHIRCAPFAVFVSGKRHPPREAVCYAGGGRRWLVELADVILARQYRVQRADGPLLREWFFDAGLLEEPVLHEEDAAELGALFADELEESSGEVLLALEKYTNGGPLLATWEVLRGKSGLLVRCDGKTEIYTDAALERMLTDFFGEE